MRTLILTLLCSGYAFAADPGAVRVARDQKPHQILKMEVAVPASVDDVWQAFTTRDGLKTWLAPDARVELRQGGEWTAVFPNGGTGGGTILNFTPKSEIVMRAMAPEWFPTVRAERTTATFRFVAKDDRLTLVQLEQTGWKHGDEWDRAYDYLASGNAMLLDTLRQRFTAGPIDWAQLGSPAHSNKKD